MIAAHPIPIPLHPIVQPTHLIPSTNYALPLSTYHPLVNTSYVLTNTHHPLWNTHTKPNAISSPSAPRLSQVDPLAALWARSRGPPPEYATIDPRKLRARYLRPIFTRRSVVFRRSQGSCKDRAKLSGTGRCRQRPAGQLA